MKGRNQPFRDDALVAFLFCKNKSHRQNPFVCGVLVALCYGLYHSENDLSRDFLQKIAEIVIYVTDYRKNVVFCQKMHQTDHFMVSLMPKIKDI